ncbi:hypothetical protein K488DRAFT_61000 [Vararia minispora EC-137]|uniref:Uncharacterized protein n=1 Tax=Vararia minispora EC-137 TaxID=1314806 RepID=A0ACB8Q7E6_9AGAM|nr:hypothetical protein K488DRAFT_61000 [Vararia minispora EC-137]
MPQKKGKKKAKKQSPLYSPPADFLERLRQTQNWRDVADLLCDWLEIPDLETRQGLKKAHRNFDDVVAKLEKLFAFAVSARSYDLAGGIVAIYSRLSADAILRDRVVQETGFLEKLFVLVKHPVCRNIALEALATVTHHGGVAVRTTIAAQATLLLDVLDEHLDDARSAELAWIVLSHSVCAIVHNEEAPAPGAVRALPIARMVRAALFFMRQPDPSRSLAEHILAFLSGATRWCSADLFANPSAPAFLLSCAFNRDIRIRAEALNALLRLHTAKAQVEDVQFDIRKVVAILDKHQFPDHLVDCFMDYGMMQCDITQILQVAGGLQRTLMRVVQDGDLLRFGRETAQYILRSEFAGISGGIMVEDPRTGQLKSDTCGLPFKDWGDALPYCARELRERGGRSDDKDFADVLECKAGHLITTRRFKDAHDAATRAIERNPHVGFFYYVLTLEPDKKPGALSNADGLRAAKKGLKCKDLTNYVKYGLLYRGAEHAVRLALTNLDNAAPGEQQFEEGYAFALCAWEDTRDFVLHAPPDNRNMPAVCCMHVILSLLLHGHEQGPDLPQLKRTRDALRIAQDIARHIGRTLTWTQTRLTTYFIFDHVAEAVREWSTVTRRYGEKVETHPEASAVDSLAVWLERAEPEDVDSRGMALGASHYDHPAMGPNDVPLYRCSWCGNPSAVLRKCKGCGKTRYCDAACQREHWAASHRKVCARNHEKTEAAPDESLGDAPNTAASTA